VGGAGGGGSGGVGYAVFEFDVPGTIVNTSTGGWDPAIDTYVKINGTWIRVETPYVKQGGVWFPVNGYAPIFQNVDGRFGASPRAAVSDTPEPSPYEGDRGGWDRDGRGWVDTEGGAGAGGDKIICTKLYELGLMSEEIYLADQAFGAELVQRSPDIYNGYRAWAEIVVDWMDGAGPKMMPWMSDEDFSVAAKKWSIAWAQDIATPWAEEMAFKMNKKSKGSLTGRMITAAGIPICKVVGMWQRVIGPSKKPVGFGKGLSLVAVFIMFKAVAELGRTIEKFKL
jgi:hypothetical protein